MEEFALADHPALEIWPAEPETCGALEALLQALYGGAWLTEGGETGQADHINVQAALEWLRDRVRGGLIARVGSREEALAHFLNGETALFMDWQTATSGAAPANWRKNGIELLTMPYPSSTGFVIRSFELTGVCVAAGANSALAMRAAALATRMRRRSARSANAASGRTTRVAARNRRDAEGTDPAAADVRGHRIRAERRKHAKDALRLVQTTLDAM